MINCFRFYEPGTGNLVELFLEPKEFRITQTRGHEQSGYESNVQTLNNEDELGTFINGQALDFRNKGWPMNAFRTEDESPRKYIISDAQKDFYGRVEKEFGKKYVFSKEAYLRLPLILASANFVYDRIQLFANFNDYRERKGWDFDNLVPLGCYVATNDEEMDIYHEANPSETEEFFSFNPATGLVYIFQHDVGAEERGDLAAFFNGLSPGPVKAAS